VFLKIPDFVVGCRASDPTWEQDKKTYLQPFGWNMAARVNFSLARVYAIVRQDAAIYIFAFCTAAGLGSEFEASKVLLAQELREKEVYIERAVTWRLPAFESGWVSVLVDQRWLELV
jgi:hypothetical protein